MDYSTWFSSLTTLLPKLVITIVSVVIVVAAWWFVRKLYSLWRNIKQQMVYLELTPPAHTDSSPIATQQLFAALHGLGTNKRWRDSLIGKQQSFALEIVSTRQDGIRFIIRVSADQADTLEHAIIAYVPDVKVRRITDYLPQSFGKKTRIVAFRQKEHFAYPLQGHELLELHDPIGYLTNAMVNLSPEECMSLQVVVMPVRVREAEVLSAKILTNADLLPHLSGRGTSFLPQVFHGINTLLFGIVDAIGNGYHGSSKSQYYSAQKELEYQKQIAKHLKPVRTLSYFEHELIQSIHQKLSQPLFRAELRLLLLCDTKQELLQRRKSIISAMSLFSVPKYQSLKAVRTRYGWWRRYQELAFKKRLPALFHPTNILSSAELSGLYHFPHSVTAKTENVVKSLSKTLPAPVSLKNGTKLDVILGQNHHHNSSTLIGLTANERERHVYIIGGTGNGKTTMLLYSIVQDIKNGKGVAVLDPHGDLAETILRHIPEERIKDVIYLNPDDLTRPIGINLLELTPGSGGDDLLREKDLITESTISVLRKIFSDDDSGGHRVEYVLRNTIQTALTLEGANLFTIFRLLNDTKYRRVVVKSLQDEDLKNFWNNEMGKAGEFQRVKMAAGITAKIGRFLFSASAKRILEQEKSTIDFEDILDSGKILICNFSKGLLGEDTSTLFGATILAKLQVAALRRARQKQTDRTPYYLYVDEFQNFATMSFVQMLSEARKYKLFLTMAEQSTSQQDQQRLVDIILANVGTVICFRSGSPADERYVLPLFYPYIEQGEIANLPAYTFYARIAAIEAQEPMSGNTLLVEDAGDEATAQRVIEHSRNTYGTTVRHSEQPLPQISEPDKVSRSRKRGQTKPADSKRAHQTAPTT